MKTLLNKSVCLWLSLMVLLSSVGLTVGQHICLTSGKVMFSFELKEDPCTKHAAEADCKIPEAGQTVSKKCCDFKLDQHKLDLASQVKLKQFTSTWLAPQPTFSPVFIPVQHTEQEVLQYTNSSPPLYGKKLLYSLHILRV
ncbi:HYC_CC_PP family protein [Adhaeribacter soli]|uniref:Uncharacterized protein n=1 Tax=Adhaeribacter soli TaxID=2607655 RepID=A0A5N1J1A8_9BACT|nr:hypothetical protein [Adhaeribacter soli]KAA9338869.1 hypothetical protein F0P94_08730 [Adhaeribacter soli]